MEKVVKALDAPENELLFDYSPKKVKQKIACVLNELGIPLETKRQLMNQLSGYIYVEEMKHLKPGSYLRWIPLTNPDKILLNRGGVLCEIKNTIEGVFLTCKTFTGRHYQIHMAECLLFQKLTDHQLVLLDVLGHLSHA